VPKSRSLGTPPGVTRMFGAGREHLQGSALADTGNVALDQVDHAHAARASAMEEAIGTIEAAGMSVGGTAAGAAVSIARLASRRLSTWARADGNRSSCREARARDPLRADRPRDGRATVVVPNVQRSRRVTPGTGLRAWVSGGGPTGDGPIGNVHRASCERTGGRGRRSLWRYRRRRRFPAP
jgi:hypothetical protein